MHTLRCAGFLWSNWCEYKSRLGVEFGEYSLKQYRYAKDYYKLVKQELAKSKRSGRIRGWKNESDGWGAETGK